MAYQVGHFELSYPHLTQKTLLDAPSANDGSKSSMSTDHSSLVDWDGDLDCDTIDIKSIRHVGFEKA